jgi:serine/threonine protein kinase
MTTAPDGRFDRYEILGHIGTGGMGEVFKARARGAHGFEKVVALKRLRPRWARDREMAARLIDEARISARLQHANIVQVFDFGRLKDELFIVMEYVDGPSLDAILVALENRGEWISLAQTLQVIVEVARALEYAHRFSGEETVGLVHRDVTPSNILVSRDGIVKLTDFGIAAWSELDRPADPAGKPPYMAPEQLRGDPLDGRADLFSLGVTFYRLLTRNHPWPRGIEDAERRAYQPPSRFDPSLLPEIEALVAELLESDRDRRLASADLLLRELLELSYAAHIVLDPLALRPLAEIPSRGDLSSGAHPRKMPEVLIATAATDGGATILGAMDPTRTANLADRDQRRTIAPSRPRRWSARRAGLVAVALLSAAIGLIWTAGLRPDGRSSRGTPTAAMRDSSAGADAAATGQHRGIAVAERRAIEAGVATDGPRADTTAPRADTTAPRRRRASRGRAPVRRTRARPIAARKPPVERATGKLDIHVDPWAEVWVDGTKLPQTAPLRGLRLPAGTHRLRLVNPELGKQAVRQVNVPANGSIRINVSLRR